MGAPYRVMTVCTGNICRSPIAEVVLRARFDTAGLGDVVVDSTGISSEEHGNPIDPRAATALAAHGYAVPTRVARQVTRSDVATADLVLAMTSEHAAALRSLARADPGAAGRVLMYRSFDPDAPRVAPGGPEHLLDIDDPWYGDAADFEDCVGQVEAAADGIVEHVRTALAER
ncbi:low molecular weight protein-tyrosine-phosphatase [Pengzhenrongella sicca]|uniref:protein-tyrosine-phosphatase n=1 Tax=Pengzhenrongella sicca TaxID=2819238 RepID=A0A8A4ZG85_9MICO|nr:low molecular weight protein-tyrosine-phosphatase [Pengzhenrongella sicca]QTE29536.1 low molecular weight phosphotyrosine protein phosphatase [Pengzhenrongella sicca]